MSLKCQGVNASGKHKDEQCHNKAKVHGKCLKHISVLDGVDYSIDDKRARVEPGGKAIINLVFESIPLTKYYRGYHSYTKNLDDIRIEARLSQLYAGDLPKGMIRNMLCELMKQILSEERLKKKDYICLEASGAIGGSFMTLIKMYHSMSFIPVATMMLNDPGSPEEVYHVEALMRDMAEDAVEVNDDLMSVLMITTVENLMVWCKSRYEMS